MKTGSPTTLSCSRRNVVKRKSNHLHQESLTLRVKDHSDMLSAQYLLSEDHVRSPTSLSWRRNVVKRKSNGLSKTTMEKECCEDI